jgi:hypothetical protein
MLLAHFRRIWLGQPSLGNVFWQDMIVVGTAINLAALLLAFVVLAAGLPTATGVVIFLAPVPYSLLLVAGVWRSAAREASDWSWPARVAAVAWLLLALLI